MQAPRRRGCEMKHLVRAAAGLALSLAFWCVLGAWASLAQDDPAAGFVGVKAGNKIYHRPSCALLKRATPKSQVKLADLTEAETEGYRPCTLCKPNADTSDGSTKAVPGKKGAAGGGGKDPDQRD